MARCPICHTEVTEEIASFPFCTPRCRLLDLGNWLDERYVVPAGDDTSAGSSDSPATADAPPPPRRIN